MATPISGRYASVRIVTTVCSCGGDNPGLTIDNLGHWEVVVNFDEIDASCFGTKWKQNVVGMQGWSGTIEGFFDSATSSGKQIAALLDPAIDDTLIQDVRFYLQTSSGLFLMPNYTTVPTGASTTYVDTGAGCYISNVRVTHDKNGLASASYNLVGYGPLALFTGTSDNSTQVEVILQG